MFGMNEWFSTDELMHMALYASEQARHDHALVYLRALVQKEPENALVQLVLGGQYAKLRCYDKALSALSLAITLDEKLYIAHLHSALILLANNQYAKAEAALQPLLLLEETNHLFSFAKSLVALCHSDKTLTIHFMELGVSQNKTDPLLNDDITQLLIAIKASGDPAPQEKDDDNEPSANQFSTTNSLLSSTYKTSVAKN